MVMERIRNIREESNLKQKNVADILGIDRTTYTSYEIERDTIPINHLNTICNYFNISIDYALGITEIKQYENSRLEINQKVMSIRLKELRQNNKLTQKQMAEFLNTSRSTWTGYEYGNYRIPTLLLFELSKKYNYSMDYLLGKTDEKQPKRREK